MLVVWILCLILNDEFVQLNGKNILLLILLAVTIT